jgi:hypothetical protein
VPTATEYSVILALLIIVALVAIVVLGFVFPAPSLSDAQQEVRNALQEVGMDDDIHSNISWIWALSLAVFSGTLAGIAWGIKSLVSQYQKRAQVLVLEVLSDGKPRSRQVLVRDVSKIRFIYRYAVTDALSELVLDDKVDVVQRQYVCRVGVAMEGRSRRKNQH